MRNLKIQKISSMLIAMFMAFSVFAVGTWDVDAASGKWIAEVWGGAAGNNTLYVGEQGGVNVYHSKSFKYATITSVKSADSKVAKVLRHTYKDKNGKKQKAYGLKAKKTGKVKITIKYKLNGKTKKKAVTLTVKPYPNAIKSLKINGKKVKLKGDKKYWYLKGKYKKKSVKIHLEPAKGWKISYVSASVHTTKKKKHVFKEIKGAKKLIAKGKKMSFAKKWKDLNCLVELENKENPEERFMYQIDLYR